MNRVELERYMAETYHADAEFPWTKYPTYAVFRHSDNQKWFAVMMDIPKEKLGLRENGTLNVANFKCDSNMIGSLRLEPGFFPAYHMSKTTWITVALDGTVDDDKIRLLIDVSFHLTSAKGKKKG